ncbi:50S ribosomal protein HLP, mitochondrial-like [Gossypium australe]|uniref:50S ribosomal protein HLP, mitochondrial-like n=1 Tax=Gossypium australe TaxID=47621 RepID=A0A5B6WBI4_9ROSI|nr:50S ribosomal protein HLP, mitochondrial-like [Gossypium australe]
MAVTFASRCSRVGRSLMGGLGNNSLIYQVHQVRLHVAVSCLRPARGKRVHKVDHYVTCFWLKFEAMHVFIISGQLWGEEGDVHTSFKGEERGKDWETP